MAGGERADVLINWSRL